MSWANEFVSSEIVKIEFFDPNVLRGGYDALCQILELEIAGNGVIRFVGVPEEFWYEFRKSESMIDYVRKHLAGRFEVQKRLDNKAV